MPRHPLHGGSVARAFRRLALCVSRLLPHALVEHDP
jgi:hypothetical protein